MMLNTILKDIKVLEISNILAGPLVGSFLGALGADVTKIENKNSGGDITRQWKQDGESTPEGISAYYLSANNHKKSLLLDLSDKAHFAKIKELISTADIIITNLKKSSLKKFKLSANHCREYNNDLIYAHLGSYDDSELPAFDIALQAETGFISMCGTENGELVKMPVALIDVIAAHQMKEAILLCLYKKATTSASFLHVELSLYGAAITSLVNQATNYLINGNIPGPIGLRHPNIAPYGEILNTKDDGKIILAVGTNEQYFRLLEALEIENKELLKLKTNDMRISKRLTIERVLNKVTIAMNSEKLINLLNERSVPCGKIKNMEDLWKDPKANKYIETNNSFQSPKHISFTISEVL